MGGRDQVTQGYPQGGCPQGGYPKGGYPPPGGYPQGEYPPPGGYPQGGYPPQAGYPQGVVPEAGYPPPPQPGFQPQPGYAPPAGGYVISVGDLGEDGVVKGFDFSEQSIRKAFVRKVYAILMCQMIVTVTFISLFVWYEPAKLFAQRNSLLFWIALVVVMVTILVMSCCDSVRRQAPTNFLFLGIFTLAESFLLGVISSMYDGREVMTAVGITAAICLALTLFAMQTRFDFTGMGGVLLCALVVLFLFGLIAIFIPKNYLMNLVYSSLGALLFSLYLVYDTQLMLGGKHKYSISPEEYVFAALNLYLDVINIFIYILRIVARAS